MQEKYLETLKLHRLSNTSARLTVFNAISAMTGSVSMNELITLCPDINRVSVYRIIDQFEKAGIVNKVQIGWKYKLELGDAFHAHHHHMTCLKCGKSEDFEEPEALNDIFAKMLKNHGFLITQHTLELRGLCADCT